MQCMKKKERKENVFDYKAPMSQADTCKLPMQTNIGGMICGYQFTKKCIRKGTIVIQTHQAIELSELIFSHNSVEISETLV